MRPLLTLLLTTLLFATLTGTAHADYTAPHPCPSTYVVQYEDDYCFTWSRDGNRARGVTLKGDSAPYAHVVSVCAFKRLYRAHRIDWTRTERLRGDYRAVRARCR